MSSLSLVDWLIWGPGTSPNIGRNDDASYSLAFTGLVLNSNSTGVVSLDVTVPFGGALPEFGGFCDQPTAAFL